MLHTPPSQTTRFYYTDNTRRGEQTCSLQSPGASSILSKNIFLSTLFSLDRGGTVPGSIPARVNGFFIDIKSFRSHYGPGVDTASNRNEYQEYFLGVKSGRCVKLTTYHHPVPLSRNLGALNFLEPSGPVQACNRTALPF